MIFTILIYATFTGLSALAWNWQSYAAVRFMTGLGVGGEWAAGAAIVAEVFPERSRAMALGTLQALSGLGNMMAAVVTFTLAGLSWRYVYLVGALPALLVVWIRRSLHGTGELGRKPGKRLPSVVNWGPLASSFETGSCGAIPLQP